MSQEKTKDMSQYFYRASAADFMKIPGGPVAYWISEKQLNCFENYPSISRYATSSNGVQTGNNAIYVRLWSEVSISKINDKWYPYNKGGAYRKWYGNFDYVVNWQDNGNEIKSEKNFCARGEEFYFSSGITWSDVTSGRLSCRYLPNGFIFDASGPSAFFKAPDLIEIGVALMNTKFSDYWSKILNPTLHFQSGDFRKLTLAPGYINDEVRLVSKSLIAIAKSDWDAFETSWDFTVNPMVEIAHDKIPIRHGYQDLCVKWDEMVLKTIELEKKNNRLFIDAYGLAGELDPDVFSEEVTLNCNPFYRYGSKKDEQEIRLLLQCETIEELLSYAIGCMMGRYSIDKPGLILASQGETLEDYLKQIPSPRFMPDDDAILPLTDQEWFADDATNRFREFVRVVWGDEHLQENLDFVAESLCLHAIKPKRGESALDTIRRYLSTQFYKDHMRTYKKRPIYWLFSSGKQKAFECLVYLHRYNEGTLARMRTEYVIPLTAKLTAYADKLEQDKAASTSAAETKRLEKEINTLHKQQAELAEFDEKLRHFADQRIALDLDDGVKVNYGKFGDLLAEVKAVTGEKPQ
ncbi:BREX-1 system adenine-specific DNA-methyltransferase PglX [Marinobacterium sediminicola]|uniref:site-specific DNA-methyltransferase (adenine-specific) n=1 Tax=Marinobacterium sediminicola TaxID=518898 RepID=A0ABY1S333_9GAMM|nr:BREX-1 system adenine-specific DNA-methyltransferase PglX [Marinobacterium sediminicola]ULG68817.1 BREX-1 system adenine-specific DNA-methyltransferase PglX [Marinobacterium sediminicola]SMR77578.1 hypothetical protein SAMN04487964_11469 [Marinobacterium sediminicola]